MDILECVASNKIPDQLHFFRELPEIVDHVIGTGRFVAINTPIGDLELQIGNVHDCNDPRTAETIKALETIRCYLEDSAEQLFLSGDSLGAMRQKARANVCLTSITEILVSAFGKEICESPGERIGLRYGWDMVCF